MNHPKKIGQITEAKVLAKLISDGFVVLSPWGDNERYDFVIESNNEFTRIQVKTGSYKNDSIRFNSVSTRSNMSYCDSRSYQGEVDVFVVYCPALDSYYWIPINEVRTGTVRLKAEKFERFKF